MAPDIWGISAIHRPSLSCSISIVKPMTREDRRKQEKLNLVNSPIWPNLIPNALYFARELRNSFLAPGALLFWKQILLVGRLTSVAMALVVATALRMSYQISPGLHNANC